MKKRGLGRSLNAILSTSAGLSVEQPPVESEAPVSVAASEGISQLALDALQRGRYQPRREMDDSSLQELADSIKTQGILQPIIARKVVGGGIEIIAGERRWRAAKLAGLETVPVIVREIEDDAAMAIGLIENIQRENLNPIEEAAAFQRLLDEFSMTHQQVADSVGRSRAAVSNLLRLLQLEAPVRVFVEHGDLEMGHARALLALQGQAQINAAKMVAEKTMSVRETESYVKRLQEGRPNELPIKRQPPAELATMQARFAENLGAKVSIKHKDSGKGRLVVSYNSLDELNAILRRVKSLEPVE